MKKAEYGDINRVRETVRNFPIWDDKDIAAFIGKPHIFVRQSMMDNAIFPDGALDLRRFVKKVVNGVDASPCRFWKGTIFSKRGGHWGYHQRNSRLWNRVKFIRWYTAFVKSGGVIGWPKFTK